MNPSRLAAYQRVGYASITMNGDLVACREIITECKASGGSMESIENLRGLVDTVIGYNQTLISSLSEALETGMCIDCTADYLGAVDTLRSTSDAAGLDRIDGILSEMACIVQHNLEWCWEPINHALNGIVCGEEESNTDTA